MLLEVNEVSKVYKGKKGKDVLANNKISINLEKGQIFGLLGHNGAGKTTLVSQMIGVVTPTSGRINLNDKSVVDNPKFARKFCSIQPQSQVPLGSLTPSQAVSIMGGLRGGKKDDVSKRMARMFEALDIGEWAKKEAMYLSGGILRLTTFCMATIVPGDLVILDEPTNDIDPIRRRYLWKEIRDLTSQGASVVLVTHNVLEVEKVVDKVAIMDNGIIVAQGPLSKLKKMVENKMRIELTVNGDLDSVHLPDYSENIIKKGIQISFATNIDKVPDAVKWLTHEINKKSINDYSISPTSLEDVYVQLTSKAEEN